MMKFQAPTTHNQKSTKPQAPNSKFGVWDFGHWNLFGIWDLGFGAFRDGMTLLLVILILSALLSISLGIFDVVLGEFRISGEITDSFIALYAADQGMEKILYDDRVADSLCKGSGSCSYDSTIALANGACIRMRLSRTGKDTTVTSTGEYRCSSPRLAVKRAFEASYTIQEEKKEKK